MTVNLSKVGSYVLLTTQTASVSKLTSYVVIEYITSAQAQALVRETIGASEGDIRLRGLIREAVVAPAAAGPTQILVRGLARETIYPGAPAIPPTPATMFVSGIARETVEDADSGTAKLYVSGMARETIVWRAGEAILNVSGMAREAVLVPGAVPVRQPRQYAVTVVS